MEQAGRTRSHLAAERHSAILRSRYSSRQLVDQREHLLEPQLSIANNTELERRLAVLARSRREALSGKESTPSKSNSESSLGITAAIDCETSPFLSTSPEEFSPGLSNDSGPAGQRSQSYGASNYQQRLLRQASGEITAPRAPKFLQDLGRDYSRYPQSITNTRRNSNLPTERTSVSAFAGRDPSLPHIAPNPPTSVSNTDIEQWGYPDDSIGAFDPYFGGEKGFILFPDELEEDDKQHLPSADDDKIFKPKLADFLHQKVIISWLGGTLLVLGLFAIFIILPVLTYARRINFEVKTGGGGGGGGGPEYIDFGPAWAHVNNRTYPLINNVRKGLIDEDTPNSAYTRRSAFDKSKLKLVFSDEFNKPHRTFYPGDDPYWTAPDIWYGATQDMEWYDPDAVTTANGTLQLRLDRFLNHNLQFRSGMLNSWNQMCFKGGVFEISVSLAGPSGVPGLWPGAWSMGNLGRPGYKATTEGVWPYTYDSCDVGITPNQSSPDGLSHLPGQKLSSCTCPGADHPSPGIGRGAPEIDILEGSVNPTNLIGVVTQSFQVAPFDVWYRPNSDFMQIPNFNTTQMNSYCGGPFQQAISGTTLLNNHWYDGEQYQKYAFEYIPGTKKGKIAWFVGEDQTFLMDGRAIGPNGNIAARQVSEEPMSLVLNLGISGAWSEIRMEDLEFPTIMHVDYVRIYQKDGEETVTCDPEGYPTTEYIANHPKAYRNVNLTKWDETGYGWPKNELMHGC